VAIEPRKHTTRTPTRLTCAEGNMDRSDSASFCSVRRGRRPHGTPRNFMHENRETSETPDASAAADRRAKRSDVSTYQRMLNKGRLNKIRAYITDDGIFPTNIVINIDKNRLQFEKIHQQGDPEDSGIAGWLSIRPTYKSAWIIDGQHRLFAYSGHERAAKSRLSVLAFEGLAPSEQAQLFIDINAKQKSVKQSLLQELYAELHWDAEDDAIRVRAIISKAIQDMDRDPESPLYQRVQTADAGKDDIRCISLTSVYGAIEKAGFHIAKEKKGHILEYGHL
jgi:DNA sulfur modification protein DndB